MSNLDRGVEEVVYELDNIALSKATSINGVMVQMWDRKVLTAYVEQKLQKARGEEQIKLLTKFQGILRDEDSVVLAGWIELNLQALHSELDQDKV